MIKKYILTAMLVVGLPLASATAQPVQGPASLPPTTEEVILGLSQNQVEITADFDGSEILIFGAIKRETPIPDGDPIQVIVTLSGPSVPVTVRRKARTLGIWTNVDSVLIDSAPVFYAVATSGPFGKLLNSAQDLRHHVSIERAILSFGARVTQSDAPDFIDALIRIREAGAYYALFEDTVQVDQQTLFRTKIQMPPNLTEGAYTARILLTRSGKVVAQYASTIDVRKVGLERFLYNLSRDHPFAYGLLALAIAVISGWGASTMFRLLRNR